MQREIGNRLIFAQKKCYMQFMVHLDLLIFFANSSVWAKKHLQMYTLACTNLTYELMHLINGRTQSIMRHATNAEVGIYFTTMALSNGVHTISEIACSFGQSSILIL